MVHLIELSVETGLHSRRTDRVWNVGYNMSAHISSQHAQTIEALSGSCLFVSNTVSHDTSGQLDKK
jgi:hypothetical protein